MAKRMQDLVARAAGNLESLASTMVGLGDAGQFGAQEQLARAIVDGLGWEAAEWVDDRYAELVTKFGG